MASIERQYYKYKLSIVILLYNKKYLLHFRHRSKGHITKLYYETINNDILT